jgi:hypothetical protein
MKDFWQKAQLGAGGHVTEALVTITYTSVVARETVCIPLLLAALNNMDVKVGDVLNAYITIPVTEKIWMVLGPKFDSNARKGAVIVRALYCLKVSVLLSLILPHVCKRSGLLYVLPTLTHGIKE